MRQPMNLEGASSLTIQHMAGVANTLVLATGFQGPVPWLFVQAIRDEELWLLENFLLSGLVLEGLAL